MLIWRRSSRCEAQSCVEVATADAVHVRDAKHVRSPVLTYSRRSWGVFTAGIRAGVISKEEK